MFRTMKWVMPLVAVTLLLAVSRDASAQEAKKETGSVSGTVLDKDGKPAAGAQVRLFQPFERGQRRGEAAQARNSPAQQQNADEGAAQAEKPGKGQKAPKGDRPKPVATTTTDNDGKFAMSDVPVGKYIVHAMIRGQGMGRADVEVTAGGTASAELMLKDRPADKPGRKAGKKGEAPAAE